MQTTVYERMIAIDVFSAMSTQQHIDFLNKIDLVFMIILSGCHERSVFFVVIANATK